MGKSPLGSVYARPVRYDRDSSGPSRAGSREGVVDFLKEMLWLTTRHWTLSLF